MSSIIYKKYNAWSSQIRRAAALSYDGSRSACLQLLDTKDDSSTGLPGHAAPPWLTDLRHLVPLQVAFEEEVKEKDAVIADYEREVKWLDKIFCWVFSPWFDHRDKYD